MIETVYYASIATSTNLSGRAILCNAGNLDAKTMGALCKFESEGVVFTYNRRILVDHNSERDMGDVEIQGRSFDRLSRNRGALSAAHLYDVGRQIVHTFVVTGMTCHGLASRGRVLVDEVTKAT